jgi:hypothetical protein
MRQLLPAKAEADMDQSRGEMPLTARWALVGATLAGVIGGIAGLVIGISVYAPTAWFAVFEIGLPAAVAGGVLGLLAAVIVKPGRRTMRRTHGDRQR